MQKLIKELLDGTTTLMKEIENKNPKAMQIYQKYFINFDLDYFNPDKGFHVINKDLSVYDIRRLDIPQKGILANDGKIYSVIGSKHFLTALWLRLNNIDLENSVRYFSFLDGLEFYPSYECFGKIQDVQTIEQLKDIWYEQYENGKAPHSVIGLNRKQMFSIKNLGVFFHNDAFQALSKTNCFGFYKRANQYEDEVDGKNAKYNKLIAEDVLGYDEEFDNLEFDLDRF